jgi:hypothetical protein
VGSFVGAKRPPSPGRAHEARLSLATALPLSVWQEHLMPLLSVPEALRLRVVCKALRGVVAEFPTEEKVRVEVVHLEAALTCLPAIKHLYLTSHGIRGRRLEAAEESRLVELLRGHGGTLKRVEACASPERGVLLSAVQAGALPNLTYFDYSLGDHFNPGIDREILSGGMLPLLEEVDVDWYREWHVAALEPLRRLPHLRRLHLRYCEGGEAAFPPFIPPSLKFLFLDFDEVAALESVLRELPSMLEGVVLEEIVVVTPEDIEPVSDEALIAECGAALARVLRACSPSLKIVRFVEEEAVLESPCIPALLSGLVSCCDTLEVLHCSWRMFSALPATCPSFPRLTELRLYMDGDELEDEDVVFEFSGRIWEIMASGRLPALASFLPALASFSTDALCQLAWGDKDGRLARAFEAVAGTLTSLTITDLDRTRLYGDSRKGEDLPAGAAYELGAAIGKLRRLKYLRLRLRCDGRDYHAVARGMAASGGCPDLSELVLHVRKGNLDWLTVEPSLILPSVRDLTIYGPCTEDEALLLCCGLAKIGYRYRFDDRLKPASATVRACMRAILQYTTA